MTIQDWRRAGLLIEMQNPRKMSGYQHHLLHEVSYSDDLKCEIVVEKGMNLKSNWQGLSDKFGE